MSTLVISAASSHTFGRSSRHTITVDRLSIDVKTRMVKVAGVPAFLTRVEYDLLMLLASEPTRVFTRDQISRAVYGYAPIRGRSIDSHASRLRIKLNTFGDRFVVNVWGVGYRLTDGASS